MPTREVVDVVWVPGAFELPAAAAAAAESRRYGCLVALGAVIRGDTPHFEYVAGEAARGLQRGRGASRPPGGIRRADGGHAAAGGRPRRRERRQQGLRGCGGGAADRRRAGPAPGATMLRTETKSRARALQILYAWELQGAPADAQSRQLVWLALTGPEPRILDRAEELATDVVAEVDTLDAAGRRCRGELADEPDRRGRAQHPAAGHPSSCAGDGCRPRWRSTRPCGWPTGSAASGRPGFVNGVLDGIARSLGRL